MGSSVDVCPELRIRRQRPQQTHLPQIDESGLRQCLSQFRRRGRRWSVRIFSSRYRCPWRVNHSFKGLLSKCHTSRPSRRYPCLGLLRRIRCPREHGGPGWPTEHVDVHRSPHPTQYGDERSAGSRRRVRDLARRRADFTVHKRRLPWSGSQWNERELVLWCIWALSTVSTGCVSREHPILGRHRCGRSTDWMRHGGWRSDDTELDATEGSDGPHLDEAV